MKFSEAKLTENEMGNAVLDVAVRDQWFFDGPFLKDNLPCYKAVSDAQHAKDKKWFIVWLEMMNLHPRPPICERDVLWIINRLKAGLKEAKGG